jgi:hypothetical protein
MDCSGVVLSLSSWQGVRAIAGPEEETLDFVRGADFRFGEGGVGGRSPTFGLRKMLGQRKSPVDKYPFISSMEDDESSLPSSSSPCDE